MFDFWDYTVPKNTAESALKTVNCHISPGILTDVRVYFPLGCAGVPKCRVRIGERPILPRSKGKYVTGDGADVVALDIFEPTEGQLPYLKWELWNPSTGHDHTLYLKATWITTDEMAIERELLAAMLNRLDLIAMKLTGAY